MTKILTMNPAIKPGHVPALGLWQPWASLATWRDLDNEHEAVGVKAHETRHWRTDYRGPVIIQATIKWNTDLAQMCVEDPFRSVIERYLSLDPGTLTRSNIYHGLKTQLPFGALVGYATVVDCLSTDDDCFTDWDFLYSNDHCFGDFDPGRFAWRLRDPVRFETPIPYKGGQGWFNVPLDILPAEHASALRSLIGGLIGRH